MYGPEYLHSRLQELGFDAVLVKGTCNNQFVVIPEYTVSLGIFAQRSISLGIPAPADFPSSVGASIHVKAVPQLLLKEDSIPNVQNIIDSTLGSDWFYWSHNFGQPTGDPVRWLISKINGIFQNAKK